MASSSPWLESLAVVIFCLALATMAQTPGVCAAEPALNPIRQRIDLVDGGSGAL